MSKKPGTSKPQQHHGRADKPSPSEYRAKPIPGARRGDWQGSYVPETPRQKKAVKYLRKVHAPLVPGTPGLY